MAKGKGNLLSLPLSFFKERKVMKMKLLTATFETQGRRKNDFFFCNEGEIVKFSTECDGEPVDGNCGCKRCMIGLESNAGTTTMKVAELALTKKELLGKLRKNYRKAGWYELLARKDAEACLKKEAGELIESGKSFRTGDIIEKRGNVLRVRERRQG